MASAHLILTAGGPGELAGWIAPLVHEVRRRGWAWRLSLVLWPGLMTSGKEAEIAREWEGLDSVLPPARSIAVAAGAAAPSQWPGDRPTIVLHTGGARTLSLLLGRRLGCPVYLYTEAAGYLQGRFDRVYCTDASTMARLYDGQRGTSPPRVVGNLLVDAVAGLREIRTGQGSGGKDDAGPTIGLLPGSRLLQLRHALPILVAVVRELEGRLSGCRCIIARSAFTPPEMFVRAGSGAEFEVQPDAVGALETADAVLVADGDVRIPIVARENVLARADVLIGSPGTNTAEAAALGIPMVVVAPYLDLVLSTGPFAALERLPVLGRGTKRLVLRWFSGGARYYAHANIKAGKQVVPEFHGAVDPAAIAAAVVRLAGPETNAAVRSELEESMGPEGAARGLVNDLREEISRGGLA